MKGNCGHSVEVEGSTVVLSNDDDSHYHTIFESRAEVEAFIQQLQNAAMAAFGERHPT